MKSLHKYLILAGIAAFVPSWASAYEPIWGYGEVITQLADNTQSNAVADLIETEGKLIDSKLDGLRVGYNKKKIEKNLSGEDNDKDGDENGENKNNGALTDPSAAITGQCEGLSNIMGKDSSYGRIQAKKCGANADAIAGRIKETLVLPAKKSERDKLTTAQQVERATNRNTSIESAGISTLTKAWIVETEAAGIAEAISDTQEELNNAESQMTVLISILRLQEETQKNINTRLSLMGDGLISTGLSALDSGI